MAKKIPEWLKWDNLFPGRKSIIVPSVAKSSGKGESLEQSAIKIYPGHMTKTGKITLKTSAPPGKSYRLEDIYDVADLPPGEVENPLMVRHPRVHECNGFRLLLINTLSREGWDELHKCHHERDKACITNVIKKYASNPDQTEGFKAGDRFPIIISKDQQGGVLLHKVISECAIDEEASKEMLTLGGYNTLRRCLPPYGEEHEKECARKAIHSMKLAKEHRIKPLAEIQKDYVPKTKVEIYEGDWFMVDGKPLKFKPSGESSIDNVALEALARKYQKVPSTILH